MFLKCFYNNTIKIFSWYPKHCNDLSFWSREFFYAKCAQFFFNIYEIRLNDRHFFSITVIIYFWDKPYQKVNFKSHSNIVIHFVNKEKCYQICTCPIWFYFILLFCDHFFNEIEKCQLPRSLKMLYYLATNEKKVRFEDFVWFCFISIVWIHFSHETEKFRFRKSLKHFNIFLTKKIDISFKYVLLNNVWFGSSFVLRFQFRQ